MLTDFLDYYDPAWFWIGLKVVVLIVRLPNVHRQVEVHSYVWLLALRSQLCLCSVLDCFDARYQGRLDLRGQNHHPLLRYHCQIAFSTWVELIYWGCWRREPPPDCYFAWHFQRMMSIYLHHHRWDQRHRLGYDPHEQLLDYSVELVACWRREN